MRSAWNMAVALAAAAVLWLAGFRVADLELLED